MDASLHTLCFEQLRRYRHEILFIRFTFSIVNCLSLVFLGYVFYDMIFDLNASGKDYVEIVKAGTAILVPYLTTVAQGYWFPKFRKMNSIQYLLDEDKTQLTEDELKMIYDRH